MTAELLRLLQQRVPQRRRGNKILGKHAVPRSRDRALAQNGPYSHQQLAVAVPGQGAQPSMNAQGAAEVEDSALRKPKRGLG